MAVWGTGARDAWPRAGLCRGAGHCDQAQAPSLPSAAAFAGVAERPLAVPMWERPTPSALSRRPAEGDASAHLARNRAADAPPAKSERARAERNDLTGRQLSPGRTIGGIECRYEAIPLSSAALTARVQIGANALLRLSPRTAALAQIVDEAWISHYRSSEGARRHSGFRQIAFDLIQKLHFPRLALGLCSCYVPTRKAS